MSVGHVKQMIIWRETEKVGLTNVRRFSQQTMEAHLDIQIALQRGSENILSE